MLSSNEVDAIIGRIRTGTYTESDLFLLRTAQRVGQIQESAGGRSVTIGGKVRDTVIVTGNGNKIVLNKTDASALNEALSKYNKQVKYTHRRGLLLLFYVIGLLTFFEGITTIINLARNLPWNVLTFSLTFLRATITPSAYMQSQIDLLSLDKQQAFGRSLSFFVISYFIIMIYAAWDKFSATVSHIRNNYASTVGLEDPNENPLRFIKKVASYFSEWANLVLMWAIGSSASYTLGIYLAGGIFNLVAYVLGAQINDDLIHVVLFYKWGVLLILLSIAHGMKDLIFRTLDPPLYLAYVNNERKWNGILPDPFKNKAWLLNLVFFFFPIIGMLWFFFVKWNPLDTIYSSSPLLPSDAFILTYIYYGLNILVLLMLLAPKLLFGRK